MTCLALNLLKSRSDIPKVHEWLRSNPCGRCDLGWQKKYNDELPTPSGIKTIQPVLYRGNPLARQVIIGEGPGKWENIDGQPFVGPAGKLLDEIFASVGWDTNKDWLLTNAVLCRPLPVDVTNKENRKPSPDEINTCSAYWMRMLSIVQPHTVVLLGATATYAVLGELSPMKHLVGKEYKTGIFPNITFFVMYHPAALLHANRDPARYKVLSHQMWDHIQLLRQHIDERTSISMSDLRFQCVEL